MAYLKRIRKQHKKTPPRRPPLIDAARNHIHRDVLMNGQSLFVMEVEGHDRWTIRKVGQGVAALLGQATAEGLLGESLATVLRCEDVQRLHTMWPTTDSHGVLSLSPNYIFHSLSVKCCRRNGQPAQPGAHKHFTARARGCR